MRSEADFKENFLAIQKLTKPKAVVFDWDNTLVDTWPIIQTAIDSTMIKMGKEAIGLEGAKNKISKSMRDSFPAIFGDKWVEAGDHYLSTYASVSASGALNLLDGAYDLISKLSDYGVLQAVISNKVGKTLRSEVKNLGLQNHFFSVIGSGDTDYDKPAAEPVHIALLGSDISPAVDEVWFIGDTISDFECAYLSGCRPVIFGDARTIPIDLLKFGKNSEGPVPIYVRHEDLITVLDGLFANSSLN